MAVLLEGELQPSELLISSLHIPESYQVTQMYFHHIMHGYQEMIERHPEEVVSELQEELSIASNDFSQEPAEVNARRITIAAGSLFMVDRLSKVEMSKVLHTIRQFPHLTQVLCDLLR